MEEEDEHFRSSLEEFIGWFRNNGLNLGEKACLQKELWGRICPSMIDPRKAGRTMVVTILKSVA
jgi:hypothetical protein